MDGHVNKTSSIGWIYVVVSDTRSPGPRQPVPSWLPGSAVAVYASLIAVFGLLLNVTVLGLSLTGARSSSVPLVRRLLTANFSAIQLLAAVLVVPGGVATEALGRWAFGGSACRAWLLAQIALIAGTMWSVVGVEVHCLLRLAAPRRAYAALTESHPRLVGLVFAVSSWVAAGLAALPIGLALAAGARQGTNGDGAAVLEDVCAVSLSRDDVITQSLTAFLLPAAIGLTGSVSVLATTAFRRDGGRGRGKVEGWSGWVASAGVGACAIVLWLPFFILYTLLPFCGNALCVDPGVWTLLAWLGQSTVVVAPVIWFVDAGMRSDAGRLAAKVRQLGPRCCCCKYHEHHTTSTTTTSSVSELNVGDESSGLISVTKYLIDRPAQQQEQK